MCHDRFSVLWWRLVLHKNGRLWSNGYSYVAYHAYIGGGCGPIMAAPIAVASLCISTTSAVDSPFVTFDGGAGPIDGPIDGPMDGPLGGPMDGPIVGPLDAPIGPVEAPLTLDVPPPIRARFLLFWI
jgi:hypothetical protein